jgi:two-component system, OmpR family, alkaline phosphatase synthesis response regulator PhoP
MGNLVLIVEDDMDFGGTLGSNIRQVSKVSFATDGEQAIAKILDEKPSLIILDLLLPKLDGFKVLERLRKYPDKAIANTPVIVISNLWSDKDILLAKSLMINSYYVKANMKLEEVIKDIKETLKKIESNKQAV